MADLNHHKFLERIALEDVRFLKVKDTQYAASWKESGGRSAWFMLRRKMDRLINFMKKPDPLEPNFDANITEVRASMFGGVGEVKVDSNIWDHLVNSYFSEDIFAKIAVNGSGEDGSVLAEVRDLRRYLLLVEAEMMNQRAIDPKPTENHQECIFRECPTVDLCGVKCQHMRVE